jgi:hypothetical protein
MNGTIDMTFTEPDRIMAPGYTDKLKRVKVGEKLIMKMVDRNQCNDSYEGATIEVVEHHPNYHFSVRVLSTHFLASVNLGVIDWGPNGIAWDFDWVNKEWDE